MIIKFESKYTEAIALREYADNLQSSQMISHASNLNSTNTHNSDLLYNLLVSKMKILKGIMKTRVNLNIFLIQY